MANNNYDFSLDNVTQKPSDDLIQVKGHLACKGSTGTAVMRLKVKRIWVTLQGVPQFPSQLNFVNHNSPPSLTSISHLCH